MPLYVFIPDRPKPAPQLSAETLAAIKATTPDEALSAMFSKTSTLMVRTVLTDQREALEALRAVGLETLHDDDAPLLTSKITHGPNGGPGLLIDLLPNDAKPTYDAESQQWVSCAPHGSLPGGRAFIGWAKSSPPTPERLARRKQAPGSLVELADERRWRIPVARQWSHLLGGPDRGELSATVAPLSAEFLATAWASLLELIETKGNGGELTQQAFHAATLALSINYRMSRDLVSALNLLEADTITAIRAAACDFGSLAGMVAEKSLRKATYHRWLNGTAADYAPSCVDLHFLQNQSA